MAETTVTKKKIADLSELLSLTPDSDFIPVTSGGVTKKVSIQSIIDKTHDTFRVLGDDNVKYILEVVNGELRAVPEEVYTKAEAVEGENTLYDGLVINQMYGGGTGVETTPVSHSFIELYNFRNNDLNLKGVYLWYRAKAGTWESLPLKGIVPAKHSFLIRCGKHQDFYADGVRCNITDYDMSWDKKLVNKGFSVYLCIGADTPEDNPTRQTKDALGNVTATNGRYIDLLGCGGKNADETVVAYETRYLHCMDKNTAVHRVDYANASLDKTKNIGSNALVKGNNEADCEPINYLTCNVDVYRPRCVKDGRWNEFYDKPKQTATTPSMVNICFGNAETTRTFTFQTPLTKEGFVKYRKEGETAWTRVETTTEVASHVDGDTTVHRAIVHDIPVGKYEYQVGTEGCSSDIFTFEVKQFTNETPINMLWTTDQQSWTEREYDVWRIAGKILNPKASQFDFHLNTGDISQNASRTFEWKYYYDYAKDITRNMPHVISCGNNDLIAKKFSDAFNYYITNENKWSNSVYWFDLGYTHFVVLNSNEDKTYMNGQGSIGGYVDTDAYLQAQAEWLDTHLTEVEARATKPRWVILIAHLSPFTVGRAKRLQRWVATIEKHKVDLFLCGHNHAYSRSKALYTGFDYNKSPAYNDYVIKSGKTEPTIVDEFKADGVTEINRVEDIANGTVYILNQACGFKLTGKEKPITLHSSIQGTKHDNGNRQPWWIAQQSSPTNPCYCTLNITKDAIKYKAIAIKGIVTYDEYKNTIVNEDLSKVTEEVFDTLTINYADRNK